MNEDHSGRLTKTGESNSSGTLRAERVGKAIIRLEACLQARLTEIERLAYFEFLLSMNTDVMEEAVENVVRDFRPERTRLPLPAEFLLFCPEISAPRRRSLERMERQWRDDFERENADGSVDRVREEVRHQFRTVFGINMAQLSEEIDGTR